MRYWVCINNQVTGPFEKEKLPGVPGFTPAVLVCPETQAGGETPAWKAATAYPEIAAAPAPVPAPAPEQPRKPAAESPLMMTMRGTLIETPSPDPGPAAVGTVPGEIQKAPAPVPAAAAAPGTTAPRSAAPQADPFKDKLDHMSAMLVSLGNSQSQVLERLDRLERAVLEMKSLLFPVPPGK